MYISVRTSEFYRTRPFRQIGVFKNNAVLKNERYFRRSPTRRYKFSTLNIQAGRRFRDMARLCALRIRSVVRIEIENASYGQYRNCRDKNTTDDFRNASRRASVRVRTSRLRLRYWKYQFWITRGREQRGGNNRNPVFGECHARARAYIKATTRSTFPIAFVVGTTALAGV